MSESNQRPGTGNAAADISQGVAAVVDAALGVGVSVARAFAQATSPDRPIDPPSPSTPPIQAIVRYGVTAFGNLVSAVVAGAGGLRKTAGAAASQAASAMKSGRPRVRPGATLRVPLSVENPGEQPMLGLSPRLRSVRLGGREVPGVVTPDAVTFSPAHFDVAPRDFEKLTVTVPVPENAPEGEYEIVFALGANEPDLFIALTVANAPAGGS